jgi:hypothetical protein
MAMVSVSHERKEKERKKYAGDEDSSDVKKRARNKGERQPIV